MRSSSPFIASAVRAITGMSRVAWSPLSKAVASRPSMPGSWISIRIRLGCAPRASVSPASASVALNTVWPADCNRNVASVMLARLSSMIRTFAMSDARFATRQGPPDFGHETGGIELGFVHDRRHMAMQCRAVLGGDVLGGNHHDRDARRIGLRVKSLHHVEAA